MGEKTLLVVDDEPINLALIRALVEEIDLPVKLLTASDGAEALALARELKPSWSDSLHWKHFTPRRGRRSGSR